MARVFLLGQVIMPQSDSLLKQVKLDPVKDGTWSRLVVVLTCWVMAVLFWVTMSLQFIHGAGLGDEFEKIAETIQALADEKLMIMQIGGFIFAFSAIVLMADLTDAESWIRALRMNAAEMATLCANFFAIFLLAFVILLAALLLSRSPPNGQRILANFAAAIINMILYARLSAIVEMMRRVKLYVPSEPSKEGHDEQHEAEGGN